MIDYFVATRAHLHREKQEPADSRLSRKPPVRSAAARARIGLEQSAAFEEIAAKLAKARGSS